MGGIARLARDLGFHVSGSDANTYPPMSTQLESLGIQLFDGFRASNVPNSVDMVVVGNSISRGNPELEFVLDNNLPYTSGAQWLGENVLQDRWVLGVAGTHGKTTTSSLLAWILEDNGLAPGYLIGGVPENFGVSARLGDTPFFVIEADEYDTAFSDKRSKFVHYHPKTLVLNNLEFDHADIFQNLFAIQTQFHHLIKIIPSNGKVIYNIASQALQEVIAMGHWSELATFGGANTDWQADKLNPEASEFTVTHKQQTFHARWSLIGEHNMENALSAIAAAHHVGVPINHACDSLSRFKSVKRRLELIFENKTVRIFDDFAHHPTAIAQTVAALRHQVADETLIAILEPRSNTMKLGVHKHLLADALRPADTSFIYANEQVKWDVNALASDTITIAPKLDTLLQDILDKLNTAPSRVNLLIMSNGGFGNIYQRLIDELT